MTAEQVAVSRAHIGSGLAIARLQGMKLRASLYPATAAVGSFPYPARTCAEWEELPSGEIIGREMTPRERQRDAKDGSARLRDAILRMAA